MSIDTRTASGRRQVRYLAMDELLKDAEQMAACDSRTVGNWTLGQILSHIAIAINMGTEQAPMMFPAPVRFLARLLMKKRVTEGPLKAGFQVPKRFASRILPPPTSVAEGLDALRSAIARWQAIPARCIHPIFGPLTAQEWEMLELRHAELHMSFVVPEGG